MLPSSWIPPPVYPPGPTCCRRAGRLALALLLTWTAARASAGEPFAFDPVAELRQALRTPIEDASFRSPDLQRRRQLLNRCVARLCRAPDLREALLLQEWQAEDAQEYVALTDQAARAAVARRFERAVLDILQHGDGDARLAAVNVLAETGPLLRDTHIPGWSMRGFTGALADLVRGPSPVLTEAAARALSRINADPGLAVPALARLIQGREPLLRRVGAGALTEFMQVAAQGLYRRSGTPGQTSRAEVLALCRLAVPAACAGLGDADAEVRGQSIEALRQTVAVVRRLVSDPTLAAPDQPPEKEDAQLLALARALKEQTAGLTTALRDPSAAVRLRAHQTLEEVGAVWTFLQGRDGGAGSPPTGLVSNGAWVEPTPWTAGPSPARPLLQRLHAALPSLVAGVADPDVRVRRAAIEALEVLGADAAPAAPVLVRSLADRDLFVRWAAARTLGKMAPAQAVLAVPGLQPLLGDRDLDVRLAAAEALKRYGPAAQPALPVLMDVVQRGDATMRLAALEVLESIGPAARAAVPAIAAALQTPDGRVRKAAAQLLGRFGPLALGARASLALAMQDVSPDVRQAAGDALLHVGPPPVRPEVIAQAPAAVPLPPAPGTGNPPPVIWRAAHSVPAPATPQPPAAPTPPAAAPVWRSPQTNTAAEPEARNSVRILAPTVWHAAPAAPLPQLAQVP